MRLATLRTGDGTRAVRVDSASGTAVEIGEWSDLGGLLRRPDWERLASEADGRVRMLADLASDAWAPVVPRPGKIFCVGLNYQAHILEMGRELPTHPTLFAKFADALIGAGDDILIPRDAAGSVDWEGELAVVIGRTARFVTGAAAEDAIAGFTVMNDVTVREHQYRTTQWLQGKTFESSTPLGPVMVTPDELPKHARLTTFVSGARRQSASTAGLVFDAAALITYISRIVTLHPGDVIATGTPAGVGHASAPPDHLVDGEQVVVSIEGIGALRNKLRIIDPAWQSTARTRG